MTKITIELTDEQLEELKQRHHIDIFMTGYKVEEPQRKESKVTYWFPEHGDEVFYILQGMISSFKYESAMAGFNWIITSGLYWKTQEEAEKALAWFQAVHRVKKYISENFGVFEPDWEDEDQDKHRLFYIPCNDHNFNSASDQQVIEYSPIGYLQLKDHCEQLIKDCEEDLLTIYRDGGF